MRLSAVTSGYLPGVCCPDLPHWRTVYDVADGWHNSGAAGKKHDELRRQCRIAAGRRSEPAAAVIGSQPVKAAEEVSGASCGYDAGKKVNSRKRHIAVDTIGLLLTVLITAAEARIATEQSRYRCTVRDCERLPGHHETIRVLPG